MEGPPGVFAGDPDAKYNWMAALALLERGSGRPGVGARLGYRGLSDADRALVDRLLATSIAADPSLADPEQTSPTYVTAGLLMAMTVYLATGGPDEPPWLDGIDSIRAAIENGARTLARRQGALPPRNVGGWNYSEPGVFGDISVTQFVCAGLAAAQTFVPDATQPLLIVPRFLREVLRREDGSFFYSPGSFENATPSVSGIWCMRLVGVALSDPTIQDALRWLRARWYVPGDADFVPYYRYWTASKALSEYGAASEPLGPGLLDPDRDLVNLDPAAVGHPDEAPSIYFDLAHALLSWRDPERPLGLSAWARAGARAGRSPLRPPDARTCEWRRVCRRRRILRLPRQLPGRGEPGPGGRGRRRAGRRVRQLSQDAEPGPGRRRPGWLRRRL
jgi:hypothetical protein